MNLNGRHKATIKSFPDGTLMFSLPDHSKSIELTMKKFLGWAEKILLKSDLIANDPRPYFVKMVSQLSTIPGYNEGGRRFNDSPPFIKHEGDGEDPVLCGKCVRACGTHVLLEDFLLAVVYALTNTDLTKNDPRPEFIKRLNAMYVYQDTAKNRQRLKLNWSLL